MDGKEIELKLAIAAEQMDRLQAHPLLAGGPARVARLDSTYYDTADLALAAQGITLRLRRDGERRIQTVKNAGSRASGLFSRKEWEAPVEGNSPCPTLMRATGLPVLREDKVAAALAPVFATRVERSLYQLDGDGWEVELALDRGEIAAAGKTSSVHEVELELRHGAPIHLYDLARMLAAKVPMRLHTLSKSDRGFALAAGTRPHAVKAKGLELAADLPVWQAFQAIARDCLHHVLANQAPLLECHDPEAVHQMRVALRRLRSALGMFRKQVNGAQLESLRTELKWLMSHLGPARDSQVFLAEMVEPVAEQGGKGLAKLAEQWRQRRDQDFANAQEAVADNRFTLLLLDLGAWVEAGDWLAARSDKPIGRQAPKMLAKLHGKMLDEGGRHLHGLAPETLHQVRIRGKRLRYAGEFLASLFPGDRTKPFLKLLAELQECLGGLNDIATAHARLDGGGAAARKVAEWHEARRPKLLEDAAELWEKFRKAEIFWG